jgi:hypothetical protein
LNKQETYLEIPSLIALRRQTQEILLQEYVNPKFSPEILPVRRIAPYKHIVGDSLAGKVQPLVILVTLKIVNVGTRSVQKSTKAK